MRSSQRVSGNPPQAGCGNLEPARVGLAHAGFAAICLHCGRGALRTVPAHSGVGHDDGVLACGSAWAVSVRMRGKQAGTDRRARVLRRRATRSRTFATSTASGSSTCSRPTSSPCAHARAAPGSALQPGAVCAMWCSTLSFHGRPAWFQHSRGERVLTALLRGQVPPGADEPAAHEAGQCHHQRARPLA